MHSVGSLKAKMILKDALKDFRDQSEKTPSDGSNGSSSTLPANVTHRGDTVKQKHQSQQNQDEDYIDGSIGDGKPRAILISKGDNPFQDRILDLSTPVKIGRAVGKHKLTRDCAIFDCKVLSRNHAVLFYEAKKFYLQDTRSSNGTFINGIRLSASNEVSMAKEVYSGDCLQFGVDVSDSTKYVTIPCIAATIKVYHPDGTEEKLNDASLSLDRRNVMNVNLATLAGYLKEACKREEILRNKLITLSTVLHKAQASSEQSWKAMIEEDRLVSRIESLQSKLQSLLESDLKNPDSAMVNLRSEIVNLQEIREKYESKAKETIQKALQEKLMIISKNYELALALSTSEEQRNNYKDTCEHLISEMKKLAEEHDKQFKELQKMQGKNKGLKEKNGSSPNDVIKSQQEQEHQHQQSPSSSPPQPQPPSQQTEETGHDQSDSNEETQELLKAMMNIIENEERAKNESTIDDKLNLTATEELKEKTSSNVNKGSDDLDDDVFYDEEHGTQDNSLSKPAHSSENTLKNETKPSSDSSESSNESRGVQQLGELTALQEKMIESQTIKVIEDQLQSTPTSNCLAEQLCKPNGDNKAFDGDNLVTLKEFVGCWMEAESVYNLKKAEEEISNASDNFVASTSPSQIFLQTETQKELQNDTSQLPYKNGDELLPKTINGNEVQDSITTENIIENNESSLVLTEKKHLMSESANSCVSIIKEDNNQIYIEKIKELEKQLDAIRNEHQNCQTTQEDAIKACEQWKKEYDKVLQANKECGETFKFFTEKENKFKEDIAQLRTKYEHALVEISQLKALLKEYKNNNTVKEKKLSETQIVKTESTDGENKEIITESNTKPTTQIKKQDEKEDREAAYILDGINKSKVLTSSDQISTAETEELSTREIELDRENSIRHDNANNSNVRLEKVEKYEMELAELKMKQEHYEQDNSRLKEELNVLKDEYELVSYQNRTASLCAIVPLIILALAIIFAYYPSFSTVTGTMES